jgi:hypothetical protein
VLVVGLHSVYVAQAAPAMVWCTKQSSMINMHLPTSDTQNKRQ